VIAAVVGEATACQIKLKNVMFSPACISKGVRSSSLIHGMWDRRGSCKASGLRRSRQPVPVWPILSAAPMALAELAAPSLGMFRFDTGQVQMSQEDSICDHTVAEQAFNIRMRSFEDELADYADRIG